MSQGSQCPSGGNAKNRAATLVNFVCDSSVVGAGSPQIVGSLPPGDEDAACAFIIEWKTPVNLPRLPRFFKNCFLKTFLTFSILVEYQKQEDSGTSFLQSL